MVRRKIHFKNKRIKRLVLILLVLILALFILLFYLIFSTKKTVCTFESNQKDYQISTKYKIYSKNDLVTKVISKSIVESSSTKVLKEMEQNINKQYKILNDKYSGYDYKVKVRDKKLISVIKIDYKKYNMKDFIRENGAMRAYVNINKQYTLDGAKEYYKSIGATCNN